MKKKIIFSFIAATFAVLSASAQEETLIVNAGNIEHITVGNDLNVVLVPSDKADGSVSLDPVASDKLDLKVSKNRLQISSLRRSGKEKATVYLHVNKLKSLTVEQNSRVKTIGILDSHKLDVYVDGEAWVHVRTTGEVDAHALNGAELKVDYLTDKSVVKR